MKQSGMVRKIDELGRIVIPKEMRKKLNMVEGENVEFFFEEDCIVLKKYSMIQGVSASIEAMINALSDHYLDAILLCDNEHIIYASSDSLNIYQKQKISDKLKRQFIEKNEIIEKEIEIIDHRNQELVSVIPIYKQDEIYGGLVLVHKHTHYDEYNQSILSFINEVIKQEIELCV